MGHFVICEYWSYQLQTKIEVYIALLIGDRQMQNKIVTFQCRREQSLRIDVPKCIKSGTLYTWTGQAGLMPPVFWQTHIYLTQEVIPWLLLRHALLSFEASWNLLDAATFNVSCTQHQKWATSYFINAPPTWSCFSVNTEALGFEHGLMCSSLRSWILYLQWHSFVLTLKIEQEVYLDATESTRHGTAEQEMEHSHWTSLVFNRQASNLQKWKHYMFSKYALLSVESAGYSPDVPHNNASIHTMRMEPLLAVGCLRILNLCS